jgi:hypothetical protein
LDPRLDPKKSKIVSPDVRLGATILRIGVMQMNLEDLSRMSEAQLREKANEILAKLETAGGLDQGPILSASQFYIDEIERRAGEAERRRQSRIALRDFILELVVIILIGGELYFGITGGNQQLSALEKLNTNAGQQLTLLQKMNASADETARTMKSLSAEQDAALTTQQQTLQIITQMNGALQTQLGLSFTPELTVTFDEPSKLLLFQNFGKTNLFMWGMKTADEAKEMSPEPRIIVPGAGYKIPADDQLKARSERVPKGGSEQQRLDVYLKTANEKKFTASYLLFYVWKNDALIINVHMVGIKPEGW